jgi:multiple antibiotic resistance protein
MVELFLAILASLFSIMNPFGAVPLFLGLTSDYTTAHRNSTVLQISFYVVLILAAFYLAGTFILEFYGISIEAMRIAGGIMIFLTGYGLLTGKQAESRTVNTTVKAEALEKEDIAFSPMALPMLAGPGSISLLITFHSGHAEWSQHLVILAAILTMGIISFSILRSARFLYRLMGVGGIKALTRIMGFLTMAIGVEFVVSGIVKLVTSMV